MKYSVKYEVEVDSEIQGLVEKLDDAFESVTEEFIADLASRHYSDWIGSGMSVGLYETMEADILRRALRVIAKRWAEHGN